MVIVMWSRDVGKGGANAGGSNVEVWCQKNHGMRRDESHEIVNWWQQMKLQHHVDLLF